MGKEKTEDTEEMIRQIQQTRRELAASLYNDFFGGAGAPSAPSAAGAAAGNAAASVNAAPGQDPAQAPKAPVEAATGPAPKAVQEQKAKEEPQEDPMETLNNLIGLEKIKHDVKELTDFARIQKARKDAGLKSVPVSLHLVFTGNPGTGKTTVARILAKLYNQIGILSKGQLVEVDRSGLVAGYVGQTALKTQEQIQNALGGVLFIDEAYTLAAKNEDFGQEAIDTILKAMEDHRDDLIVIVAGYTEPMEVFINSNPGLKSRFNKYIEFPDYSIDELMAIFDLNCKKYDYIIDESARNHVREKLSLMKLSSPENFANARAVRNLFEEIITNQASRIAAMEKPSLEDMKTITNDDLSDEEDEAISAKAVVQMLSESGGSGILEGTGEGTPESGTAEGAGMDNKESGTVEKTESEISENTESKTGENGKNTVEVSESGAETNSMEAASNKPEKEPGEQEES